MYNLNWSRSDLTRQKLGTFCEYYAKMLGLCLMGEDGSVETGTYY